VIRAARLLVPLFALAAVGVTAFSVATAAGGTERGQKKSPPTQLWNAYPLGPRAKVTKPPKKALKPPAPKSKPSTATPPEPRVKSASPPPPPPPKRTPASKPAAASYQISTDQSRFPRVLLVAAFLVGLLVIGVAVLVGRGLVPLRARSPRPPEPGGDLFAALSPKPATVTTAMLGRKRVKKRRPKRRAGREAVQTIPATAVAICAIKLWRGFVKWHLYAVVEGSEHEPIAYSAYFRLIEDDRGSDEGLAALAGLVEELEQDGWTVVADGPAWYQHRLERIERI